MFVVVWFVAGDVV